MDSKIQYEVFKNGTLTKEQIAENLKKDIAGVVVTIHEILNSPVCMEALVDAFYTRYEDFHKQAQMKDAIDNQK